MGWDGRYDWTTKGKALADTRKDFAGRIVAERLHGDAWYAAVRSVKDPDVVIALVVLFEKHNGTWMTKLMDETVHPYYYDASPEVLRALTPLDNAKLDLRPDQLANMAKWRDMVRLGTAVTA